ncbi:NAD(P)H-dependent oxidoreductase [Erwiniaceae bacterium BAC15a-03b]|uniref:NAD(P)H-dependent oxidoreductase n=1 Tax=Winslowiella arboricola TaxID=2978220 RepID=A0A9J6Q093_9GAMM|nr:NAD(P)H-dependent oxidoreductase [Winslowiella arboricola]MCU5775479.1 NAD(P)H-dependent oxidoreductase [Winslowiella arboricola]MCU5779671.1 NAD(P)H-dependent oxidoreductase [Winslowiella arboricola]
MHALIVVAHPLTDSLTHAVAAQIAAGVSQSGADNSAEIADLAADGFDPRFGKADIAAFNLQAAFPADVIAEQQRVDAADALVLVYPVYWWSMPALMKGWIDRVFNNGWAYEDADGRVIKKLQHLPVHLVAIGAADHGTWQRHGYDVAMHTQVDHGIFDYCGAPVKSSTLLLQEQVENHLQTAQTLGTQLFTSHRANAS